MNTNHKAPIEQVIKGIGKHIETLARNNGINKRDLAEKAGIHINTVTAIISGADIKLSTLIRVSRVLGNEEWLKILLEEPELTPMQRYMMNNNNKIRQPSGKKGGPLPRSMGRIKNNR